MPDEKMRLGYHEDDAREIADAIELMNGLAHVALGLIVGGPDLALALYSPYSHSDLAVTLARAEKKVGRVIKELRGA